MLAYLNPKALAVIGASADETKLGGMLVKNMIDAGFKGKLYPINPKGGEIMGYKAYANVKEIGEPVDVAVVAVKRDFVIQAIKDCGEAGIKYVSILTAGFKEDSPEGKKLEEELVATAKACGVRIMGPNCFGNMNIRAGVNYTFSHIVPKAGNISIMSQSGAVGSSILDWFCTSGMGVANFVTFGNKSDLDEADFIRYFSEDPDTKVIGMYIEGISNGERFIKAIEEMPIKKPIVVFKSGKTEAGSKAASSHTGSIAGSDAVNNVVFKKLNIHRAFDLDEMFDALMAFSACEPMKKDAIGIITNAGGLGVMSADAAFSAQYVYAAKLADSTIAEFREKMPKVAGLTNPIDIRGDASPEDFETAVRTIIKDPSVGGLVIMGSPLDTADLPDVAKVLVKIMHELPYPATTCFAGGKKCGEANAILKEAQFPTYPTPDRAVRALDIMRKYQLGLEAPADPLKMPKADGRKAVKAILDGAVAEGRYSLTEAEGKKIFQAYGVPVPGEASVTSEKDAVDACNKICYPVVMKIISPDIQHKTDVGGVVVGVKDAEAAKNAFNSIMANCKKNKPEARLDGVSIQQMVSGQEVILSMVRDVQFGPVVSFGLGGIYVEILREISQKHVPMTEQQLDDMITSTKAYKLLSGARGLPVADIDAIKDVIRRIVLISVENPEIKEIEINPVLVGKKGEGCYAVDCLCTIVH
ncbi:Acyl-CoA synthetase (NDP forming) [Thermoplasmatales archaeon BRNA1]|nr:Acyl-CoA synthetase (NDP forming) [Thermoplasmatales archaeon BRNA1]